MKKCIILTLLAVSGCALQVGSYERGLYTDRDRRNNDPNRFTFGIKLALPPYPILRPVPKSGGENPWRGGEPAFVIRSGIPVPLPFIGAHIGNLGFYLGGKVYEVTARHCEDDRYGKWIRESECPKEGEPPKYYIAPSARMTAHRLR